MKNIEQKDRRQAQRTVLNDISLDVYSQKVKNQIEARGKICDISHMGTKFISNKPYISGSKIHLNLLSTNYIPLLDIFGRVVRCEQQTNVEFTTAVEFIEDPYQKCVVDNYIVSVTSLNTH